MKIRTFFSLLCLVLMMLLFCGAPLTVHADPCASYRSDYESKNLAFLSAQSNAQRMKVATAKATNTKVGPELKDLEDEYDAGPQSFLKSLLDSVSVHPNVSSNASAFFGSLLNNISQAQLFTAAFYAGQAYTSAQSALVAAEAALANCTGQSILTVWCERGAKCKTPPGVKNYPRDHYVTDCSNDVEGAFNLNVGCPGEWWKCDGKNVCPRSSDHVVTCKGAPECDDMIGPDRQSSYHQILCETNEAFIGCGQKYSICSKSQKQAHRGVGRCPLSNNSGNPGGTTGTNPVTANPPAGTTNPPADPPRPCGHSTSASGDHSLQASCTSTDANGNSCTVTSFYACQSHTHSYPEPPPPTVRCGRSACTASVSSSTEHQSSPCAAGDTYYTCNPNVNVSQWENRHRVRTCRRSGCGNTWQLCQSSTPSCSAKSGKRCSAR